MLGLRQLFGLGGPMSAGRIARASKLACNPFAQPEVRMREMQRLLKDGSPAAIEGLLKRFGANAQGHIADEEEKGWLCDALVQLGEPALMPLQAYVRQEARLGHALATYRRIAPGAQATEFFAQTLREIGPEDHRRTEAKQQLVLELGGALNEPQVAEALAPFLLDHSDDVRYSVLGAIGRALHDGVAVQHIERPLTPALRRLVCDADVSARIGQQAAALLAAHPWPLGPGSIALSPELSGQFSLDGRGILHGRASA